MRTHLHTSLLCLVVALVALGALKRSGVARVWSADAGSGRPIQLKIWDWWSPSVNEEYGAYFAPGPGLHGGVGRGRVQYGALPVALQPGPRNAI